MPETHIFDFLYTNQNNQDAIKKKEYTSTFGRKKVPEKVPWIFLTSEDTIMATINPIIIPERALKNGTNKLRIAVRHKSRTCYIVTNIILKDETQFRNGRIVKHPDACSLNRKLREMMDIYEERLDKISNKGNYTCEQIRDMIKAGPDGCDCSFKSIAADYVSYLLSEKRTSYAKLIERSSRYFCEYCRGNIDMENITPALIKSFSESLRRLGKTQTYINTILSHIKVIVNKAVSDQMVSYSVHPFASVRISPAPVRDVTLSIESFLKIMHSNPDTKKKKMARDLFMISFMLGGMNLIDIMNLDFREKEVRYVRTKSAGRTQQENVITFDMPEGIDRYTVEWMQPNGKLDFGYKFTYHNFSQYVSYAITDLSEELGIKERVVFYSARKSFAQFASDICMPDSVINYCLGHSDRSKGVIRYYTKVRSRQASICIKRVCDYVRNPELYKDFIELREDALMRL